MRDQFERRFAATGKRFATQLADWYGKDKASQMRHAEAFEICEYGRLPSRDELRKLFPFSGEP